jgi:hypothetical protein
MTNFFNFTAKNGKPSPPVLTHKRNINGDR